jgi:ribulose kinase
LSSPVAPDTVLGDEYFEDEDASLLGAVILASAPAGIYPDTATACAAMVRTSHVIHPDPFMVMAYQHLYTRFQQLDGIVRQVA